MKSVLVISGSDSSGAAGLQCDIKTVSSLGLHARSVVTSLTTQDSTGVHALNPVAVATVKSQLSSVYADRPVDAVKSGMIPTVASIEEICGTLKNYHLPKPFVLDPVLRSTSGTILMEDSVAQALLDNLFPLATVVTPNINEAEMLSGIKIATREDAVKAGRKLLTHGSRYVLVKGGHLTESPGLDILVGPKVDCPPNFISGYDFAENREVRGTGCAYASAIACGLASGFDLVESIGRAKSYITTAILNATQLSNDSWLLNHKIAGSDS